MPHSLSNDELANRLQTHQVDQSILDEAASRLRRADLQHLLTMTDAVAAVAANPLIDDQSTKLAETSIMATVPSRKSPSRIESLARRILAGDSYDHSHVMTIVAFVIAQDASSIDV